MKSDSQTRILKILLRELLWTFAFLAVALWVYHPDFSSPSGVFSGVLDINIHDTYFVVEHSTVFAFIAVSALFVGYLARAIATSFRNNVVNGMLAAFNLAFAAMIFGTIKVLAVIAIFPGAKTHPVYGDINTAQGDLSYHLYLVACVVEVICALILIFALIRLFLNLRKGKTKA